MSVLTVSDLCEMVRRRFGLSEDDALRFQPLVDPALRRLSYDVARNPNERNWLMSDPATTTALLDADGVANLTTLITSPRILLECLKYGEIYPPADPDYPTQPFRLVDNPARLQLAGAYDGLVLKACVDGLSLRTKSPDNNLNPLVGTISFRVNYWATLLQLPEPLIQKLVDGPYWAPNTEKKNAV